MRATPRLWRRTMMLDAVMGASTGDLHVLAARATAALGVSPEEILADAAVLARRCRAAGATSSRQMAAVVAREAGLDPDAVWEDAQCFAAEGSPG
jgi:hypothetical protein